MNVTSLLLRIIKGWFLKQIHCNKKLKKHEQKAFNISQFVKVLLYFDHQKYCIDAIIISTNLCIFL